MGVCRVKDSDRKTCEHCGVGYIHRRPGHIINSSWDTSLRFCSRKCQKTSHLVTSEKTRLKRTYGLSPEDLETMKEAQDGKCLICLEATKLFIDHCHASGVVRGLLCSNCNSGLGFFRDRPDLLEAAIQYLRPTSLKAA